MSPVVPATPTEGDSLPPDADVATLAELFRSHPAWVRAAHRLDPSATTTVYFRHRPGEVFHLANHGGVTRLSRGPAAKPDFSLCFTPAAIRRLAAVQGGVGDFAVALFELILAEDDECRVGFRILAPFATLVRRGYVQLLLAGGGKLLAFGAERGVRTLADLQRLVMRLRRREPYAWERPAAGDEGS